MNALSIDVRTLTSGGGEVLDILGADITVKATGERGGVFLADHPVPVGYFVPPHSHAVEEEMFFVTEGEVTFDTDAGIKVAGPGDFVHAPQGSRHGFSNPGPKPAHMIVVASPGAAFTEFFRSLDRKAKASGITPADVQEIAAEYGIAIG